MILIERPHPDLSVEWANQVMFAKTAYTSQRFVSGQFARFCGILANQHAIKGWQAVRRSRAEPAEWELDCLQSLHSFVAQHGFTLDL